MIRRDPLPPFNRWRVGDRGWVAEFTRDLFPAEIVGETKTLWIAKTGTSGDLELRFRKRDGMQYPQPPGYRRWLRVER